MDPFLQLSWISRCLKVFPALLSHCCVLIISVESNIFITLKVILTRILGSGRYPKAFKYCDQVLYVDVVNYFNIVRNAKRIKQLSVWANGFIVNSVYLLGLCFLLDKFQYFKKHKFLIDCMYYPSINILLLRKTQEN